MANPIRDPEQLHHVVWKGRAAVSNRESRFNRIQHEPDEVAAEADPLEPCAAPATEVRIEVARSIISSNRSPDVPFDRSINPYRGCEHGCVYCYARPSHTYLGLSAGLDFETKIFAKTNAAELLRKELSRAGPDRSLIALGANTDPYQPTERRLQITRSVLEVLSEFDHPIGITTKSSLVTRDIDILAPMAAKGLVKVLISVGTLDADIARTMEPRANSPARRIQAVEQLAAAGIPTGVIVAPIVPALTDPDLERVLEAAAGAGARYASYVVLRLPLEVSDLFTEWLETHHPLRARHVMSLIRQMRGGRNNDSTFGMRMRGNGPIADLIERRFKIACKRLGLNADRVDERMQATPAPQPEPAAAPGGAQMKLFE
ncbi:MAG TPA: PA0069 family radical SAM protein [Burkholderiaceae bacterium]|jgi:DNA repair photolyase|nr:PA0069 family radical SAM protein [Burkholderiaceae bacterium]